ncbi:MAG: hypothetical protein OEW75_11770 [Cyclobacteriaceae bacterium]|nr:hypothetical protein [Cyclobacteriaceae bacterium]
MKKSIIIVIGILTGIFGFLSTGLKAQSIDEERMERDLNIAENILSELMSENREMMRIGGREIEGRYVEGYGVIFSVKSMFFSFRVRTIRGGNNVVIQGNNTREREQNREEIEEDDELITVEREEVGEESTKILEDTWKTFLVDYADMIGQLKPSDKVMIKVQNDHNPAIYAIGGKSELRIATEGNGSLLSAELKKSDITDYKQGKISREEALKRVKVSEYKPEELERDVVVFKGIFSAVFSNNTSRNYFVSSAPYIERIKDMGVIYNYSFFSSYPSSQDGNRMHEMPTVKKESVSQQERDEIVKTMYPEFEKDVAQAIVEYGKGITSLGDNELLIIRAKITTCEGCGIPKTVEFSIKAKVLKDYSVGKITQNAAVKEVKIVKTGNQ